MTVISFRLHVKMSAVKKSSLDSSPVLNQLLSCCRWFLHVQKSQTAQTTSWSAASKLPWWGWRRWRPTLTRTTEETRRHTVQTGTAENTHTYKTYRWSCYVTAALFPFVQSYSVCCCQNASLGLRLLCRSIAICWRCQTIFTFVFWWC